MLKRICSCFIYELYCLHELVFIVKFYTSFLRVGHKSENVPF